MMYQHKLAKIGAKERDLQWIGKRAFSLFALYFNGYKIGVWIEETLKRTDWWAEIVSPVKASFKEESY